MNVFITDRVKSLFAQDVIRSRLYLLKDQQTLEHVLLDCPGPAFIH